MLACIHAPVSVPSMASTKSALALLETSLRVLWKSESVSIVEAVKPKSDRHNAHAGKIEITRKKKRVADS